MAIRRLVRPGSVVLDIGANIGALTLELARQVGSGGKVFAFEPTSLAHSASYSAIWRSIPVWLRLSKRSS